MQNSKYAVYRLWHNLSAAGRVGYIGKDSRYPNRVCLPLRAKQRGTPKLYHALNKYPLLSWKVQILARGFKSLKSLAQAEIFFIKKFNSRLKGYNCTDGGEGSPGRIVSLKTRKLLASYGFSGKKHSVEVRKKMSSAQVGRVFSKSHRKKISKAKLGVKLSETHRLNLSKARRQRHV